MSDSPDSRFNDTPPPADTGEFPLPAESLPLETFQDEPVPPLSEDGNSQAVSEPESDFEITPEKMLFPEGVNVDPQAAAQFADFVKSQKLNVGQVNNMIEWYGKFAGEQTAAARQAEAQNIRAYNDAVAAIPQEDLQYARQAVEKFAASPEDKAFLKKAFVAPAVLKVLAAAGRATAEHGFIQSPRHTPVGDPLAGMYKNSIQQGG